MDYPYLNTDLQSLKGERWADIPGLDAYGQVSSLGRIKRIERELLSRDGKTRILPERIILPRIAKSYNKLVGDYLYQLYAHVCMDGCEYNLSIRRLVYHCFVQQIVLDDLSICIVSKEGNGLMISPDNLERIDRKCHTARIYTKQRMVSTFGDERYRLMGMRAALTTNCCEVSQYDKLGKRIRTFNSMAEAARATAIRQERIGCAVRELEPTAGGFFWRRGSELTFDVDNFLAGRRQAYKEKRGAPVTQYDNDGNPVAHYLSLRDACEAVSGYCSAISAVTRGIGKTAYGYRWKRGLHTCKIKPLGKPTAVQFLG